MIIKMNKSIQNCVRGKYMWIEQSIGCKIE